MASLPGLLLLLALASYVQATQQDEADIAMVTDRLDPQGVLLHGRFTEILGSSPLALHFTRFAKRYGKQYSSAEEVHRRFGAFVENVKLIKSTNRKKLSYRLGLNQFADLTREEFRQSYLMGGQQNCSATRGNHKLTDVLLPSKKDWRENGIVSPVKNQGVCGSCWTFSTTGALEAAHAQATGKLVLLSEQQLVDCAGDYDNFGCDGGLPSHAFEYIKYNGGLDTEDAYPYRGKDGLCNYTTNAVGAKVYDVVNITMGAEHELKHAVGLVRPVSVAFDAITEFSFYESGVFSSLNCQDKPESVNHAVLVVGYDVDENGNPYWIVKNSWGENWGNDGYFNMEMGKNMCGIATCASYPVVPEGISS